MFRHYRVILRKLPFITLQSYISWMRAPWGWHDGVETCRLVIIYKLIVILLLLLDLQNSKKMHGTCIKMCFSYFAILWSSINWHLRSLAVRGAVETCQSTYSAVTNVALACWQFFSLWQKINPRTHKVLRLMAVRKKTCCDVPKMTCVIQREGTHYWSFFKDRNK